jgi:hypothetical protein
MASPPVWSIRSRKLRTCRQIHGWFARQWITTHHSLQTGLGGRVTIPLKMASVKVAPQGYALYQHEFANGSRGLNGSLSQGSSTFIFQTDAAKRNFALVGASVTARLKENLYAKSITTPR